jgi:hypothetical protein
MYTDNRSTFDKGCIESLKFEQLPPRITVSNIVVEPYRLSAELGAVERACLAIQFSF